MHLALQPDHSRVNVLTGNVPGLRVYSVRILSSSPCLNFVIRALDGKLGNHLISSVLPTDTGLSSLIWNSAPTDALEAPSSPASTAFLKPASRFPASTNFCLHYLEAGESPRHPKP